jgi:hypothetical protein
MEVEYELTAEDLIAFQRYYQSHPHTRSQQGGPNPFGRLVWWLILTVVAVVLYFAASADFVLTEQLSYYLVAILGGAAFTLFGIVIYGRSMGPKLIRKVLNQGRNAEKLLGWRRFSIDAEAARNTTDFASVTYLWKGIDKIVTTREHAFFYFTTQLAFILPRRAFPDDQAFNDFVETARRYRHMASVGEAVWEVTGEGLWERRDPTGIQAPDQSGKSGTVEGIIPKEGG